MIVKGHGDSAVANEAYLDMMMLLRFPTAPVDLYLFCLILYRL